MEKIKKETAEALKEIICNRTDLGLTPDQIDDDQALFEGPPGALGLDSIEALELVVGIEEAFGFTIDAEEINVVEKFYSVNSLTDYVLEMSEKKQLDG